MLQVNMTFYDGKGHFHEQELVAGNMPQLVEKAISISVQLEKDWGNKVKYRKKNGVNPLILKVKVRAGEESSFKEYLDDKAYYYQKLDYGIRKWRVDLGDKIQLTEISNLPFVEEVEDMPMVVLDF